MPACCWCAFISHNPQIDKPIALPRNACMKFALRPRRPAAAMPPAPINPPKGAGPPSALCPIAAPGAAAQLSLQGPPAPVRTAPSRPGHLARFRRSQQAHRAAMEAAPPLLPSDLAGGGVAPAVAVKPEPCPSGNPPGPAMPDERALGSALTAAAVTAAVAAADGPAMPAVAAPAAPALGSALTAAAVEAALAAADGPAIPVPAAPAAATAVAAAAAEPAVLLPLAVVAARAATADAPTDAEQGKQPAPQAAAQCKRPAGAADGALAAADAADLRPAKASRRQGADTPWRARELCATAFLGKLGLAGTV